MGATVVPAPDGNRTTIAIVEADRRRSVVQSSDPAIAESFLGADPVGCRVEVTEPGTFVTT